jgi:hypothetical protein
VQYRVTLPNGPRTARQGDRGRRLRSRHACFVVQAALRVDEDGYIGEIPVRVLCGSTGPSRRPPDDLPQHRRGRRLAQRQPGRLRLPRRDDGPLDDRRHEHPVGLLANEYGLRGRRPMRLGDRRRRPRRLGRDRPRGRPSAPPRPRGRGARGELRGHPRDGRAQRPDQRRGHRGGRLRRRPQKARRRRLWLDERGQHGRRLRPTAASSARRRRVRRRADVHDLGYDVFAPGGYERPSRSGEGIRPALPQGTPEHPELVAACETSGRHAGRPRAVHRLGQGPAPRRHHRLGRRRSSSTTSRPLDRRQWERIRTSGSSGAPAASPTPGSSGSWRYVDDGPPDRPLLARRGALLRVGPRRVRRAGRPHPLRQVPRRLRAVDRRRHRSSATSPRTWPSAATPAATASGWRPRRRDLPPSPPARARRRCRAASASCPTRRCSTTSATSGPTSTPAPRPASYTLGLIEAMLSGVPVVSIGPRRGMAPPRCSRATRSRRGGSERSDRDAELRIAAAAGAPRASRPRGTDRAPRSGPGHRPVRSRRRHRPVAASSSDEGPADYHHHDLWESMELLCERLGWTALPADRHGLVRRGLLEPRAQVARRRHRPAVPRAVGLRRAGPTSTAASDYRSTRPATTPSSSRSRRRATSGPTSSSHRSPTTTRASPGSRPRSGRRSGSRSATSASPQASTWPRTAGTSPPSGSCRASCRSSRPSRTSSTTRSSACGLPAAAAPRGFRSASFVQCYPQDGPPTALPLAPSIIARDRLAGLRRLRRRPARRVRRGQPRPLRRRSATRCAPRRRLARQALVGRLRPRHPQLVRGRPPAVLGFWDYYADQLAGPLWIEGETAWDIESRSLGRGRGPAPRFRDDEDFHRRDASRVAARFRQVVNFDAEEQQIRALFAQVLP